MLGHRPDAWVPGTQSRCPMGRGRFLTTRALTCLPGLSSAGGWGGKQVKALDLDAPIRETSGSNQHENCRAGYSPRFLVNRHPGYAYNIYGRRSADLIKQVKLSPVRFVTRLFEADKSSFYEFPQIVFIETKFHLQRGLGSEVSILSLPLPPPPHT